MHPTIRPGRTALRRLGSLGFAGLLLAGLAGPALAHEEREIGGYAVEVGFIDEPVFVGEQSGLELIVNKDDKPVEGLDQTLQAEVIVGDAKRDLPLTAPRSTPGDIQSVFIPTVAGKYTFHITGDSRARPSTSRSPRARRASTRSRKRRPVSSRSRSRPRPSSSTRRQEGRRGREPGPSSPWSSGRPGSSRASSRSASRWPVVAGRHAGAAVPRTAAARRVVLALTAAAVVLVAGPVTAGPALDRSFGLVAIGHSQLVSSSPGAGETVLVAPTEIRLVFSEPVEPRYTSLDLLDTVGKAILVGVGAPDPADARVLVAPIPAGTVLADGVYTVNWRALSAADGHATDGFVTFGLGAAATGGHSGHDGTASSGGSGGLHSGHSGGAAIAEIQGKVLAYGGTMLAFGLAILGWLVLRPALGRVPRGTAWRVPGPRRRRPAVWSSWP